MKFSEMPYSRPDLAEVRKELAELTKKLRGANDYTEARALLYEQQKLLKKVETAATIAQIRHSVDTRDAFYDEENRFWDDAAPELEEEAQNWTAALLESPFRSSFAEEFGEIVFLNAEIALRTFSPEIIPQLKRENELTTEYGKLLASAQIPFEGKSYTLAQLAPFKNDADDARRLAAWKAEGNWYKEHQEKLDAIYDELTHLRDSMGKALGHENYIPLGYDRMQRNSYTKEDIKAFREAVVRYVVPLAAEIRKEQAKRLGVPYPLSFSDNALLFRSGNAKPAGDADAILEAGRLFYRELSPETGRFFDLMLDNELMDVLSTEGKEGGGYCTGLYEYGVPFIFANFNGTRDDVETVTHEAGHAFAAWLNADRIPIETIWPSMEGCEVHSMSMEFFSWPWAEHFFGEDTAKFKYSHLAGAVTFIPYGTMVDHFQHLVYEHPDWTPKERHGAWKELLGIYMPWLRLDGEIPFYSEGEGWQRQSHIYSSPFYYIDYCLAQTVSLEFWAMIQKDVKEAWNTYLAYTRQGGSKVFTELLKGAGLESPFDPECLKKVCGEAEGWLSGNLPAGID